MPLLRRRLRAHVLGSELLPHIMENRMDIER